MVNVDKEGKVELKVVFVIVGMYEIMVLVGNDQFLNVQFVMFVVDKIMVIIFSIEVIGNCVVVDGKIKQMYKVMVIDVNNNLLKDSDVMLIVSLENLVLDFKGMVKINE